MKNNRIRLIRLRSMAVFLGSVLVLLILWLGSAMTAKADEPIVIVIDPGHGGENLGAEFDGFTEKEMTLVVARAMKEELEKYDYVTVYLTRESNVDMSLKERAAFAKEKQADFLFCLHFNSSVHHDLYGAEVWVPADPAYYVKGRQFAEIEMQLLTDMGLYSRGIKTRLNDQGDNYYGILRHCTNMGVPSALIEHCHLDQANDMPSYQGGEAQWEAFGRADAEAAARYFGLTSEELGKDYRNYPLAAIDIPKEKVAPDETEPELCEIELISFEEEKKRATVRITAQDSDSFLLYYQYSFDGGNTFSQLCGWPRPVWNRSEKELTVTLSLPEDAILPEEGNPWQLCVTVVNSFDRRTMSNILSLPVTADKGELSVETEQNFETLPALDYEVSGALFDREGRRQLLLLILLLSILIADLVYLTAGLPFKNGRRGERHNKKRKAQ